MVNKERFNEFAENHVQLLTGVLLGGIIVFSIAISPMLSGILPTAYDATLASLIIDAYLTSVLIVVYMGISSSESEQVELIEEQKEWMRANHEPMLTIEEKSYEGDDIEIVVSNRGNGIANNLRISSVLLYRGDREYVQSEFPIYRRSGSGNYLELESENVSFYTSVAVREKIESHTRYRTISDALSSLREDGEEAVTIRLNIVYDDILGNSKETLVLDGGVGITEDPTLESAMKTDRGLRTDW